MRDSDPEFSISNFWIPVAPSSLLKVRVPLVAVIDAPTGAPNLIVPILFLA